MTPVALAVAGGTSAAHRGAIKLAAEDRLQALTTPVRNASKAMAAFAAGSLAVHVLLMALAVVAARHPLAIPQQQEIAVEVVRDIPKPPPQKASEPAKSEPTKPEPTKSRPAEAQAPKMEATKSLLRKSEPPKSEPPKPKPAKAAQAKPPVPQKAPTARKPAEDDNIKRLQDELARLRAEQAALDAPAADAAGGKALAMPSIGTDGDAIGYQQLVFSQLAKAKGDEEYHGQAGTTGVKFQMDEAGKLVRVEVVQSSGSSTLDGRALDIIHRAAPFPPPPTEADRIVFANVNFVPAEAK